MTKVRMGEGMSSTGDDANGSNRMGYTRGVRVTHKPHQQALREPHKPMEPNLGLHVLVTSKTCKKSILTSFKLSSCSIFLLHL
ncbi:hypothetical protein SORBI_3008G114600 [Sorghum bicolor]|uniref:Uncharacterized protein n=1 Tax=Sorghum bicolor TaxID=4558 RepID=A0A1B6PD35_SORBI|nr:hypothetical protein SORBI_3008G114600 [Sorghum bicolor]